MITFPTVHLHDVDLADLGKLEYISLDYSEDFYSTGTECKLVLPLCPQALSIRKGMYIHLPSPYRKRSAIITGISTSESDTDTVTVSAFPAKVLVKRRVNLRPSNDEIALINFGYDAVPLAMTEGMTNASIAAESVFKTYARRHMVSPEDAKRKIQYLTIADDASRGKKMTWLAKHGDNLSDTFERISRYAEMGYHIYITGREMLFDIIEGRDLSRSGASHPIVFGIAPSTSISSLCEYDDNDYKNTAYAEGDVLENGLTAMRVVSNGDMPYGIERREIMINTASGSAVESNTEFSYEQIAKQGLAQYAPIERVSAGVVAGGDYIFLKDWDIGDVVTVESNKFGYSADIRITGVHESYSASGCTITPTFGDSPNIRNLIKNSIQKIRRI